MNRIFVIGTGIAALSIGEYLEKYREMIKFLEKNDYTGGRIKSIHVNSFAIDIGSQFFCKTDKNVWEIIRKKHLEDKVIKLDFSDMSFFYRGEIYQDTDDVEDLIKDIIEKYGLYGVEKNVSFNDWFMSRFDKEKYFIPQSIINAITFTDASIINVKYAMYILETFFDESFSIDGGLETLIHSLSGNINVDFNQVKSIYFKGDKAVYMITDRKKIPTHNDIIVSTAPPSELEIHGNKSLEKLLSRIKFRGCAVVIFETKKYFEDKPNYIFVSDTKENISVVEQINTKYHTFVGCLIPHDENVSISQKNAVDTCKLFLNKTLDKRFEDKIKNVYYMDWKKGLPLVDTNYDEYLNKLKKMKLHNFVLAGDYMTSLPSMDSAIESAINASRKIKEKISSD